MSEFNYQTTEGVCIIDFKGRILYANRSAVETLDLPEMEIVGRYCHEIYEGWDLNGNRLCSKACPVMTMIKRNELAKNFDIQILTCTGKKVWLNVTTLLELKPTGQKGSNIILIFRPTLSPRAIEQLLQRILPALINKGSFDTPQKPHNLSLFAEKFSLTSREVDVFTFLIRGLVAKEIAAMLGISPATARFHIQRILKKLRVHSKREAIAMAFRETFD